MVFYQHYLASYYPSLNWGWTGVDFFFVLSGFLITGILYDTRNSVHRYRHFYIRRSLRIFPLYYGVLLAGLLLSPVFHWVWHPAWILWPLYLGNYARFIWLCDWYQNTGVLDHLRSSLPYKSPFFLYLGHFWSLCVEEQFYLVWPWIIYTVGDRVRLRNFCLTICSLCLVARVIVACFLSPAYLNAEILYRLTPLRADALLLGGALALMLRGPEAHTIVRLTRPAVPFFVGGFVVFELLYRHTIHHLYHPVAGAPVLDTLGYSLIDLFAGMLIILSLNPSGLSYRLFTVAPLRRLGQVSYGFYIFHDLPHIAYALLVARMIGGHSIDARKPVALIAFFATLALSFLSFRYFESPFLRLKQRYAPTDSQLTKHVITQVDPA